MSEKPSKARVLIVDDMSESIDVASSVLEEQYEVFAATSGSTALLAVRSALPPDLILLDIDLPDQSGYEICRNLKADESTRHIPVIFMTVLNDSESSEKAFEAGGVDYVTKPFNPRELLARVKTQIGLSSLLQALESKVEAQVSEVTHAQEMMLQS